MIMLHDDCRNMQVGLFDGFCEIIFYCRNYNPESRQKPIGKEAAKEELLEVVRTFLSFLNSDG